jgi:signal peptidase
VLTSPQFVGDHTGGEVGNGTVPARATGDGALAAVGLDRRRRRRPATRHPARPDETKPLDFLDRATQAAVAFRCAADANDLVVSDGGRAYVTADGWPLLGSLLGVYPVLDSIEPVHVEGTAGWRATVDAVYGDGTVVGRAAAVCLRSEWGRHDLDDDALCATAQERAATRALALPLGFVMRLAGLEQAPVDAALSPGDDVAVELGTGYDTLPGWEPAAVDGEDDAGRQDDPFQDWGLAPEDVVAETVHVADPHPVDDLAPAASGTGKPRRIALRILAVTGMTAAVATMLFVVACAVGPRVLPFQSYDVDGGSMEPTIPFGSEAILRPVNPADLHVGDVIAFHHPGTQHGVVIHRIAAIENTPRGRMFVTKGDANGARDAWRIPAKGTGWRYSFDIPYAGYLVGALRGEAALRFALLGLIVLGLGVFAILRIWRPAGEAG